jgi:hypothetical protein
LFSDAALSIAIGCEIKWLYNSARRLAKPVSRTTVDAVWWRLVHHLAVGVGVPLADAARSADTLLAPGLTPSRIRLRATRDDSVAVGVDLARFHDGAALALAAAMFLAVPKARGRPRRRPEQPAGTTLSQSEMEVIFRLRAHTVADRLEFAVAHGPGSVSHAAIVLRELLAADVPFVVAGTTAAAFHCAPWPADALDVCIDASMRSTAAAVRVLNALGAVPRGVGTREGFRIDAAVLGAVPMLALRLQDVALNLLTSIEGIGEYPQVEQVSVQVPLDGRLIRVLTLPGLLKSGAPGPLSGGAPKWTRWMRFAASADPSEGTR